MSDFTIGIIMYNEEHRFLQRFFDNINKLKPKNIVVIDDGSTDNSYQIANKYTDIIFKTNRLFAQNESRLRKLIWEKCCEFSKDEDFIIIQDCDELFSDASIAHFSEEIANADKLNADAMSWTSYDMWNEKQYRFEPPYWVANGNLMTRCIRYREGHKYYWSTQKLHCGSFPVDAYFYSYVSRLQVKHMAYSSPEARQFKFDFYKQYDPEAKYGIKAQYDSILSPTPTLYDFIDNYGA